MATQLTKVTFPSGDYIDLSGKVSKTGDTMTGQLVLSSAGMKTSHTAGWIMNQYGNLNHQSSDASNFWNIAAYDGTQNFKVYFETGAVVANGNVTAPKFIGDLQGNADTWDGYHCYYDRYKYTYEFTQPTADTIWYVKIATANWNSNLEIIQIRTQGNNRTGSHVLHTGSRGTSWWGYGQSYGHRGVIGVRKSIGNADNVYLKLEASCTSCKIYTSFEASAAEIVTDTSTSYTTTPENGGFYGNVVTADEFAGNATSATVAQQLNQNARMDYGWNGVNYFNTYGTAGAVAKTNDTPTTAWWHIMRFNHANNSGYYTDLAIPFNHTSIYYKRIASGAVQNDGWIKVWDQLNLKSETAAASGTTLSLVTTGEKYTWNNKSNLTIGTTATTAMAGNTNVNNVTQTATNADTYYEVLMSATADNTSRAEATRKCPNILIRPYDDEPILRIKPSSGNDKVDIIPGIVDVYNASSKYVRISGTDLTLGGTSNTWDGTNTSLVTAVTNKLDKSGGTITGNLTVNNITNCNSIVPRTSNSGLVGSQTYPYNESYVNSIYTKGWCVTTAYSGTSSSLMVASNSDIYFSTSGSGGTLNTWDGTNTSLKTAITNKLDKSGGTMTGDIKWTPIAGQEKGLTWEELGYGDGFKIIPTFNGVNYDNRLCFKVSTGAAGAAYNYTNKAELWANGTFMCIDGHIGAKNNSITKNATQGNGGNTYRETDIAAWDSNNSPYCRIAAVCTEGGNCINHIQAINRTTSNSEFNNTLAVQATKAGTCTYSVTNAANFRTAIGAAASSSIKTKKDILDLTEEEALKLLQIRPVSFKYKDGFDIDGKYERNYGVIAEETLEIIPSVVNLPSVPEVEFDESKGLDQELTTVDYAKFVPYLIKLAQMQEKRIEELEKILK